MNIAQIVTYEKTNLELKNYSYNESLDSNKHNNNIKDQIFEDLKINDLKPKFLYIDDKKDNKNNIIKKINAEIIKHNEILFNEPEMIFDYIISNDEMKKVFQNELHSVIILTEQILYTPPYNILFGRINIEHKKSKKKEQINPECQNMDNYFYEGFQND